MAEAQSTLASKVEVDTASGYVEIPGVTNINAPDGENSVFDAAGIGDAVDLQKATGVSGAGNLTFTINVDPSDTVHQWLQTKQLAGGADVPVKVYLSATGKIKTGTGTLTKYDEKGERKDGWKADCEIKLNGQWAITNPV